MSGDRAVLARGQAFRLQSGGGGFVGELIGAGGQGAVYEVDCGGRKLALKWQHADVARADVSLHNRIARMIRQGPPDQNFVWPMDFAEIEGSPSFGYVMPLISRDRRPLKDLLLSGRERINPPLAALARACFDIAASFQKLHATGYCYQDINLGGFFIDPERGAVQICDADNISVDGELGGVYGTRKFMAPEIFTRRALPSTSSDLYSMAVLFFYILFNWHPLDGAREAAIKTLRPADEMRLYGEDPLFLFDPADASNGPVAGVHDWVAARWRAVTSPLREIFVRAFTVGLEHPGSRPVEAEWRGVFDHLRHSVAACPACGFEHGVDRARLYGGARCTTCGAALLTPPLLACAPRTAELAATPGGFEPLLLTAQRQIYDYQMTARPIVSGGPPLGEVTCHPRDARILGLQNLAAAQWSACASDGRSVVVSPGKTVRVADGLEIDFGKKHGFICEPGLGSDAASGDRT